ncbi:hypothetical protein GOP47_0007592 [Adiantum capillus-veneris]|uniref:THO complex subunit 5 n=1 Tax=Adiantum capillus-veneris TaxID=13818 RepID=A0A9D4ZJD3_ADICA|nr:hypothetical protein GOP47_0007592 [Adiantum capillus-veneris]
MKTSYDVLAETRGSIEEILAKILFIKKEGRNRSDLRELFTQASVAFLNLRQINRVILQDEDHVKQETEAAKLPVDYTTLQLNNLLYEKNHYLKAISACKDFKSKYPYIELVPAEDFYRDAPAEFHNDPILREDPHKEMLERLNFELYQRKELCKQQELLEARKKMLLESIATRRKFLSSLPSHLKALKKASLPVQQQLGILHTKRMKQHHLADLLPTPLYILYTQISAQKEAFNENIELEIVGSAKDAQTLARQQALKESGLNHGNQEESKVEDDIPDEEDELQRRRKRAKKSHSKESFDEGVYHSHPLSVLWHIFDEPAESGKRNKLLSLRFDYLTKLNIVCAGVEGDRGGPLELLANLFPDDTGLDLPTQAAKLSAGVDFLYDCNRSSHPYKWVQHLAGVDFLSEVPALVLDGYLPAENQKAASIRNGLSVYHRQRRVQTILEKLRCRKRAHLALRDQLDILACSKLPLCSYTEVPWGLYKSKCFLQSWIEILPSGLQKPAACLDDTLTLIPFASATDKMEVSPVNSLESAREDGELPSAGLLSTSAFRGPKFSGFAEKKFFPYKERSHMKHVTSVRAKGAFTMLGDSGSTGFEGVEGGDLDDDDVLLESAGLAESPIDYMSTGEIQENADSEKVIRAWEDCGCRVFNAVLRRDEGAIGKSIDLEAQVKFCCEYPVRPPSFVLHKISEGMVPTLPFPPSGVLSVTKKSSNPVTASLLSFNDLRAMEKEVNSGAIRLVSPAHENEVLAQQLSLLTIEINQGKRPSDAVSLMSICYAHTKVNAHQMKTLTYGPFLKIHRSGKGSFLHLQKEILP